MSRKRYEPITVTRSFYQLGTPDFPAYLSMGDDGMIIEGGIGATFDIIVNQVKELGIPPERIKYLTLTHTHPDHIGAVPHLKKLWPHLKVVGSPVAVKILSRMWEKEEAIKGFLQMNRSVAEILISRGNIAELPPEPENPVFEVALIVKEGDKLDLGSGIVWTIYSTPGHSPCHISLHNDSGGVLVIGDATGLYDHEKDIFWPNYFDSLEAYCNSIRRLATLSAQIGALSHNGIVEGDLRQYFQKAIKATEAYHLGMLARLGNGEDPEAIALERTKWVRTFTALVPVETMNGLTRLLLKRSQSEASKENLFKI